MTGILKTAPTYGGPKEHREVTLVHSTLLPTYSVERYYMLSELELNAFGTYFLVDTLTPFPRFIILYLLWPSKIDTHDVLQVIREHIETIQTTTTLCSSLSNNISGVFSPEQGVRDSICNIEFNNESSMYLVLDTDADETKVRRLAQIIASSEFRSLLEGVTIGIANHPRAAPGLEACMNANLWGASDRRMKSTDSKSLIGLVTDEPETLLGMEGDDREETDAVQGIDQRLVCAEWNGQGDLQSFAKRAHSAWRIHHGLPATTEAMRRKIPRRKPRDVDTEQDFDFFYEGLGWILLIFYVIYNFSDEHSFPLNTEQNIVDSVIRLLRQL